MRCPSSPRRPRRKWLPSPSGPRRNSPGFVNGLLTRVMQGGAAAEASPLSNVVVVLHEPQNVVNIAGTVRAMMNMGLGRLRLVRPAEFDAWRITGIAHRSDPLVERAEIHDTLAGALADTAFVLGTTARARTAHRNYGRPRELAAQVVERASRGTVAVLFGREDRGLSNRALDLCNRVAIVPTLPEYKSLNLAQAVLILAYEIFLAAHDAAELPRGRRATEPATSAELEETYAVLERGLDRIAFFTRRAPEGVMRTLRTIIARAEPDTQEAGILRAVGYEIRRYAERAEGLAVGRGADEAADEAEQLAPAPSEQAG